MSHCFLLLSFAGSSYTFAYTIQETLHENSKKQELNMHKHLLYAKYTHTHTHTHTHIVMLPLTVNNRNLRVHTGPKQLWRVTKTRITKKRTIPAVLCTRNTVRTTQPENICWVGTNKTTSSRRTGTSGASENILNTSTVPPKHSWLADKVWPSILLSLPNPALQFQPQPRTGRPRK